MKIHESHAPAAHAHGPEAHGPPAVKNEKALEHLQDKFDKLQHAADHVKKGSPSSVQQVIDATNDVVNEARQEAQNAPPEQRGQAEHAVQQIEQAANQLVEQVQDAAADTNSTPAQFADKVKDAANSFFSSVASAFGELLKLLGSSSTYFQAAITRAQVAISNIEHTAKAASEMWSEKAALERDTLKTDRKD